MKKIRQIYVFLFFSIFTFGIFSFTNSASAILCTSAPERAGELPGCQQMNTRQECQVFCSRLNRACSADDSVAGCDQYLAGQRANAQNRQREIDQAQERAAEQGIEESRAAAQAKKDANAKTCLCKIGDIEQPLTTVQLNEEQCQDGTRDMQGRVVFDCQYVNSKDASKILTADQKRLIKKDEYEINPLEGQRTKISELNQLKGGTIQDVIGIAIKTAMGIMGSIALIMFIYGGFLWMTAAGNSSQIDKAQDVIVYGALGIMIIFGSYAIVTLIFESVNQKNTDTALLIKTYISLL